MLLEGAGEGHHGEATALMGALAAVPLVLDEQLEVGGARRATLGLAGVIEGTDLDEERVVAGATEPQREGATVDGGHLGDPVSTGRKPEERAGSSGFKGIARGRWSRGRGGSLGRAGQKEARHQQAETPQNNTTRKMTEVHEASARTFMVQGPGPQVNTSPGASTKCFLGAPRQNPH